MITDKKTKTEIPENEEERLWFNLREKLKRETDELEESIKPKNRKKDLENTRRIIKLNRELLKTCDKNLK